MKKSLAITVTTIALLAACSKQEQSAAPASGTPPLSASGLEDKSKDDLARIRELMEKDEARKQEQEAKSKSLQQQISRGGKAPLETFGR